ncbi:hypothetical protein SISNIDRAFT_526118 [Sistotremastrum niveocremeum HHB9708]|uniref:MYND-type domain-containing protein n=1 Tax=Sistotremastrum niveocremeum HHB9708 TaxID=1314777 RepID=A0A164QLD4_9AGAM|nr:hypothetical protein SISNIDRAFT_526118 [Sistotremastrum niveocremeum HHB9708]
MDGLLDGSDQFACMRNAIGVMCDEWDMGYRKLSFEKEGKSCGILIRIISVVKSSKGGPSMILLFKSVNLEALKSASEFRQWSRSSDGEQDVLRPHHSNSVLEQKLLYRLLSINAMRVADAYRPDRSDFEHDFTLSFIRPIGPLTMSDLGKLNAEAGCFICGSNDNHLRCTGCQSIIYCSKACQKEDWRRHKPLCNSLAGGTWTTLDFSPTNNLFTSQINRFHRSDQQLKIKKPNEGPPPNIHSDQPFLIKIQVNAFGSLVYDRARSFEWNVFSAEKPDTWAACHDMARTGFLGAKCYRWAKRESDWKLSICVDRVPDEMPKW